MEEIDRVQLPHALDPPEAGIVDGTNRGRWGAELFENPLHHRVVDGGDERAEREEQRHDCVTEHVAKHLEGGQVDEHDQEDAHPPREQEDAHRPEVEAVLGRQAAALRVPGTHVIEPAIALDGAGNREGRRAKQPNPLANLAVERNKHLDRQKAVAAGPSPRWVVDVVANEVLRPDRRLRHAERRARKLIRDHVDPV